MMYTNVICVLFLSLNTVWAESIKLPDYIPKCTRDQSTINECVKKAVETLRGKLISEGIPELDIPRIDPFEIPKISINHIGALKLEKALARATITGGGSFELNTIDIDLDNLAVAVSITLPILDITGNFEFDSLLGVLGRVKGIGDFKVHLSQVDIAINMRGKPVEKNGEEFIELEESYVDVNITDYTVKVTNLRAGDAPIDEMVNNFINDNSNKRRLLDTGKPFINESVGKYAKKYAKMVVSKVSYDELIMRTKDDI